MANSAVHPKDKFLFGIPSTFIINIAQTTHFLLLQKQWDLSFTRLYEVLRTVKYSNPIVSVRPTVSSKCKAKL